MQDEFDRKNAADRVETQHILENIIDTTRRLTQPASQRLDYAINSPVRLLD